MPRSAGIPCAAILLLALALPASPLRAAFPPPLAARDGMVATDSPEASRVGAEILARGGNAVDAAVAVLFALAVAYPQAGNLGGGGFLLLRTPEGEAEAIDFRETAPAAARRDLFLGADGQPDPLLSTETLLGTGVPGTVAGLALAHLRHGTVPWEDLVAPAILLAEEGFVLDRYTAGHLAAFGDLLGRHPETARILLRSGHLYNEGDTLRQPELAATLRRIARQGPAGFYMGETAALLAAEMERGGGIMTAADLEAYRPEVRRPLCGSYHGLTILAMPPPSSGGVAILQMLGMLERLEDPERSGEGRALPAPGSDGPLLAPDSDRSIPAPGSARSVHLLAAVMQRAFADRAEFLGDPAFAPIPVTGLLDPGYLDSLASRIDTARAVPSLEAGPGMPHGASAFYAATGGSPGADLAPPGTEGGQGGEGTETTHVSIVDRKGMAVAVTTTLNTSYGNGIMVTGAGFLLNNELDDFAAAPGVPNHYGLIQGEANSVRPGARPLSSMSPTIAVREDTLACVLGSPGGPTIITGVLQTLLNVVDHGMDIQSAVAFPRVHHQWWPDTLMVEPLGLSRETAADLRNRGDVVAFAGTMGSVQGVQVVRDAGGLLLLGASDPRRNGRPVGVTGGRVVTGCEGVLGRARP